MLHWRLFGFSGIFRSLDTILVLSHLRVVMPISSQHIIACVLNNIINVIALRALLELWFSTWGRHFVRIIYLTLNMSFANPPSSYTHEGLRYNVPVCIIDGNYTCR